jgi:hypothetical protein
VQEPKKAKKRVLVAGAAALGLAGGTLAFAAVNPFAANAQDAPTTTTGPTGSSTGAPGAAAPSGKFQSNEDPAHEATETPEREAAEDAGQRPGEHHGGGPRGGMSNEDPAHEAKETPEQEAAEDARQAAGATTPSAPAAGGSGTAKTQSYRRDF